MTEKAYNPSVCESCGEEFGCGANLDGCWCTEVTLTKEIAETLQAKFKACLCPKCLETSLPKIRIIVGDFQKLKKKDF